MRSTRHIVEWYGEHFGLQLLKGNSPLQYLPPVWAVSRGGEFIGTLPFRPDETAEELEIRCTGWLRDLLGTPRAGSPPRSTPHGHGAH
jgi:hypothetical protein